MVNRFKGFSAYLQSQEFFNYLVVDIILILLLVPAVISFLRRWSSRIDRHVACFYILQLYRKVAELLLVLSGTKDVSDALHKAFAAGKLKTLCSHPIYGNLGDLLALVELRFLSGSFRRNFTRLVETDWNLLVSQAEKTLNALDQISALVTKGGYERELLFELRPRLTFLIDSLRANREQTFDYTRDELVEIASALHQYLRGAFKSAKRLPDRHLAWQHGTAVAKMIMSLPFLLLYRIIATRICRMLNRRYIDPVADSVCSEMLAEWRRQNRFTKEQAAYRLGWDAKRYRDIEMNYVQPEIGEWETAKPHLRGEVKYSCDDA